MRRRWMYVLSESKEEQKKYFYLNSSAIYPETRLNRNGLHVCVCHMHAELVGKIILFDFITMCIDSLFSPFRFSPFPFLSGPLKSFQRQNERKKNRNFPSLFIFCAFLFRNRWSLWFSLWSEARLVCRNAPPAARSSEPPADPVWPTIDSLSSNLVPVEFSLHGASVQPPSATQRAPPGLLQGSLASPRASGLSTRTLLSQSAAPRS